MQYDYLYALQCLREASPDFVIYFFGYLSELFNGAGMLIFIAILYWSVNKRNGKMLATTFFLGFLIGQTIKNIACVYRPWLMDARLYVADIAAEGATGYSFPSLHSTLAIGFTVCFAILVWKKSKVGSIVLVVFGLLTVFSRNFLGAHTPVDVIAGSIIGLVVVGITFALFRYLDDKPNKLTPICVLGIVLAIAMLVFTTFKSYPIDYDSAGNIICDPWLMQDDCYSCAGAIIAYCLMTILEHRFINYKTEGPTKVRVARSVVGILVLLVLYLLVLPKLALVFDSHWYHFLKYFALVSFAFAIHPACFTWVERRNERRKLKS